MRCSVVFSVTLRLLVIIISSSSPAVNTAAYYQRCVTTCETVPWSTGNRLYITWPVAALAQAVKPGSESRFLPTTPAFGAPFRGRGFSSSDYPHLVWYGKTTMVWLPDSEKKFENIFICFDRMYERDRHKNRQTDGHRMMA